MRELFGDLDEVRVREQWCERIHICVYLPHIVPFKLSLVVSR